MMSSTKSSQLSQGERFKETAQELGVDLDEAKLRETLRRVTASKSSEGDEQKQD